MVKYTIKGWCPSYLTPAQGKDGLFLRITPDKGYLSLKKALLICNVSIKYGNGLIDLTNRGRIQIRGIKDKDLNNINNILVENNIIKQNNNNLIISPFWKKNDKNIYFYQLLKKSFLSFPSLPDKFCIAVDLGESPVLSELSADIRLEHAKNGQMIIRADGSPLGKKITSEDLVENTILLSEYFAKNFSKKTRRMSQLINKNFINNNWFQTLPADYKLPSMSVISKIGIYFGTKFGRVESNNLKNLLMSSKPTRIRITPYRSFILEKGSDVVDKNFVNNMKAPISKIHACPGIFSCSSSSINTHKIASEISYLTNKEVHVSGCVKGCAHPKKSNITLVGNEGLIDVIYDGKPTDKPNMKLLSREEVLKKVNF